MKRGSRERRPPDPALPTLPLLLTLGALGFALLPSLLRAPAWLGVLTAALLVWRGLIAWPPLARRGWRQPPAWLLLPLALVAGRLIVGEYGTLAGRDGGTAMLTLLLALKTLETSRRRDALLLVLLGLFVTATAFFFDQNSGTALSALVSLLGLTGCALVWQGESTGRGVAPLRPLLTDSLRRSGGLLLQAAPLAAALFVLFPRPDGPLWQMPVRAGQAATSGLSDTVEPGSVTQLAQSDEVAFRASFDGPFPATSELYWRGPVLEAYDGRRWSRAPSLAGPPQLLSSGPLRRYTLTLEPSSRPWGLALDAPASLPPGTRLSGNLQLLLPGGVTTRRRLTLEAATRYRYGLD
ncbi:MAG: DUF3488 domain-containing protein, partial [Deinococcus sp.]